MEKKNRIYIIVIGVVAITLIWLSQDDRNKGSEVNLPLGEEITNNTSGAINTLEGVLWLSDDKTKGNLMLVNNYSTIYIKTSRDFSELIGNDVIVSINGTLDNFTLLDMQERLDKNGFINPAPF